MKRIFIYITFIIACQGSFLSYAQLPYHPFPMANAQWSEVEGGQGNGNFGYDGSLYTLSSDSVINGKNYVLVGYNETWQSNSPNDTSNKFYQTPGTIIGAIREDSNKKVWFRWLNPIFSQIAIDVFNIAQIMDTLLPLDSDVILYDFNVKTGETIEWVPKWLPYYSAVVTTIDSVQLLNGEWRRRINFDGFYEGSWIEGIGSYYGLLGSYRTPGVQEPYAHDLNCFTSDSTLLISGWGQSVYIYRNIGCNSLTNSINNIKNPSFSIYPNPANNKIYINSSENISGDDIEISDVLGGNVMKQELQNNSVDFSPLPAGMYFIRIIGRSGDMLYCNKLVKE